MTCTHELSVAAYALGTLDPAERAELAGHLTGCAVCRARLADVAGVAALLARVPPDVAASAVPAADERVLERVLAAASTAVGRRARRRRLVAAAAAAVVVGAAGTAAVTTGGPEVQPATTVVGTQGPVLAQVRLQPVAEGTDLGLRLSGVAPGQRCRLVVVSRDGSRDVVATWEVSYTGAVTIRGHTDVAASRIDRFTVETTDDRTLVEVTATS